MLVSNIIFFKHVVNTNLKNWGVPRKILLGSFCVNWSTRAHWLSAHQLRRRVVNPTHPWRMTYFEEFIKLACLFGLMQRYMDYGLYWYPLRLFGGQKTTRAIHTPNRYLQNWRQQCHTLWGAVQKHLPNTADKYIGSTRKHSDCCYPIVFLSVYTGVLNEKRKPINGQFMFAYLWVEKLTWHER